MSDLKKNQESEVQEVTTDVENQEKNTEVAAKKKCNLSKKMKVIVAVIAVFLIFEVVSLVLIQSGEWSTGYGDEFYLNMRGEFGFCNEGAGSPVGDADLYTNYIYLGRRNIILFGSGKIGRISITKLTLNEMTLKFNGDTYELKNVK